MILKTKIFLYLLILIFFCTESSVMPSYLYQLPKDVQKLSENMNSQAGIIFGCVDESSDRDIAYCIKNLLSMKKNFLENKEKHYFLKNKEYVNGSACCSRETIRWSVAITDSCKYKKIDNKPLGFIVREVLHVPDVTYLISSEFAKIFILSGNFIFMDCRIKDDMYVLGGHVMFIDTKVEKGLKVKSGSVISINTDIQTLENVRGEVLLYTSKAYEGEKIKNVRYVSLDR